MAEDLEKNKNYDIGENAPTQNIEVRTSGRYYPMDYTTQINILQENNRNKALIPESFAKIITTVDDYEIAQWADEQQVELNKVATQDKFGLQDRENILKLDADNKIADRGAFTRSELKRVWAEEEVKENPDISGAINNVLEQNRLQEDFNSPYLKQAWAREINNIRDKWSLDAQNQDILNVRTKAESNFKVLCNNELQALLTGETTDVNDTMKNIMFRCSGYLESMLPEKRFEFLEAMFGASLIQRATFVASIAGTDIMSLEAASTTIDGLLNLAGGQTYTYVDASNKPKIVDGEEAKINLAADDNIQRQLLDIKTKLNNKSAIGASGTSSSEIISDLKEVTKYADDLSEFAMNPSRSADIQNAIDEFNNLPPDKIKPNDIKELMEISAADNACKMYQEITDGKNDKFDIDTLRALQDRLRVDLDADTADIDWVNYKYADLTTKDGKPYILSLAAEGNPAAHFPGDRQNAAKIYHQHMLKFIDEALNTYDNDPGELYYKYNYNYAHDVNDSIEKGQIGKNNLIQASGNGFAINDNAKLAAGTMHFIAQQGAKHNLDFIPNSVMNACVDRALVGAHTPLEKAITMMSFGSVLDPKEVVRYAQIADSNHKGYANNMLIGMLASDNKSMLDMLSYSASSKLNDADGWNTIYDDRAGKGPGSIAGNIEGVVSKYPAMYRDGIREIGKHMVVQADISDVNNVPKNLENFSDPLFIKMPPGIMQDNDYIFKRSAVFKNFGEQELNNLYKSTTRATADLMPRSNISIQFKANDLNGKLTATVNGKDLTYQLNGYTTDSVPVLTTKDLGMSNSDKAGKLAGMVLAQHAQYDYFKNNPNELTKYLKEMRDKNARPGIYMANQQARLDALYKNPKGVGQYYEKTGNYNLDAYTKGDIQVSKTFEPRGTLQYSDVPRAQTKLRGRMFQGLGFAADIPEDFDVDAAIKQYELEDYLDAASSYAGKIQQTDVSVPLSMAITGRPQYFDIYNSATEKGYVITGAHLPSVTREEGVPTGFAASATDGRAPRAEINKVVSQMSKKYGIPENLVHAVIKQESGYNSRAIGSDTLPKDKGHGLMQLIPATQKALGVTDPYDIYQNVEGGVKLLAQNFKQYGSYIEALLAYNGGPKAVAAYRKGKPYNMNYANNVIAMAGMSEPTTVSINHNMAANYNKFMDADTGMLSYQKMNDFMYNLKNDPAYKDGIASIGTNRPELLEDKPEYKDFAKFRATGLFKKADYNGFQVHVKMPKATWSSKGVKMAAQPLAEDAARTQSKYLPQVTSHQIESLIGAVGDRYANSDRWKNFGLANLSAREYNDYGVHPEMLNNPILQTRVLAQEFQRAIDVLGNERKAVYALAGGTVRDENGNVKSWSQVKEDIDAFTKEWFIHPNKDDSARELANATLAAYQEGLRELRGY